jgi:hypothetical protein
MPISTAASVTINAMTAKVIEVRNVNTWARLYAKNRMDDG